jgi:lysophospholipase L1-like esterase
MQGWIPNLLMMMGSLMSVVLILEIPCRLAGDPSDGNGWTLAQTQKARESSMWQKSADPELIYETRANYIREGKRITEAHGILRSLDVPQVKPPGTYRIVVLGDSISAALDLRWRGQKPYPDRLEELLLRDSAPGAYEVLNFGTDGYTTLQEARLLEIKAYQFAPDLIVLQYCVNDTATNYTPAVWFLDVGWPRSFFIDFVLRRTGIRPSELSHRHPRYRASAVAGQFAYDADFVGWKTNVLEGFRRMASYAKTNKVPIVFVLFPFLLSRNELPAYQETTNAVYDLVRAAAQRANFHLIDLSTIYGEFDPVQLRETPDDQLHPNHVGHDIAAQAIAAALQSSAFLGTKGKQFEDALIGFQGHGI